MHSKDLIDMDAKYMSYDLLTMLSCDMHISNFVVVQSACPDQSIPNVSCAECFVVAMDAIAVDFERFHFWRVDVHAQTQRL